MSRADAARWPPTETTGRGRRDARRAVQPQRYERGEAFPDQARQLGRGEKVDLQPGLRAVEVTDGEAAVAGFLAAFMPVPDVGPGGVDPDAEQAPGGHMRGGTGQVPVGLAAVAVLEDLDADDKIKLSRRPQGIDAADDQPGRAGPSRAQLADGPRGDVQPDEVQPGVAQGHEVTAVATSDVEPAADIRGPGCADDVADEAHRRLVAVTAGCVFSVPGRCGRPGAHASQPAR
jgi:hypothetical protein